MDLLTIKQTSEKLGVTVGRIHQLIKDGRLPAEKLGSQYVIRESDLKLVENRQNGRPSKPKTEVNSKAEELNDFSANSNVGETNSNIEVYGRIDIDKKLLAEKIGNPIPFAKNSSHPPKIIWLDSDGKSAEISENQSLKGRRSKKK